MQPNIGQQVTSIDLSTDKDLTVGMAMPESQGAGIVTLGEWISNMS